MDEEGSSATSAQQAAASTPGEAPADVVTTEKNSAEEGAPSKGAEEEEVAAAAAAASTPESKSSTRKNKSSNKKKKQKEAAVVEKTPTSVRGVVSHTFGARSIFTLGRVRWNKSLWSYNDEDHVLVQWAEEKEIVEVAAYELAIDCTVSASRHDDTGLALSHVEQIRPLGQIAEGADLHLRGCTPADHRLWFAVLTTSLRQRRDTLRRRAQAHQAAANHVPPPSSPAQPVEKKPEQSPIEKLAGLRERYDTLQLEADALNRDLKSSEASQESRLKAKNTIAQLNGAIDKLQFVGVDSIVTSMIEDDALRESAKAQRKKLNADVDALRKNVAASYALCAASLEKAADAAPGGDTNKIAAQGY